MENINQHIDLSKFKNYYSGKMTPEEKTAFELSLNNDPFAKEAYDGFSELENDFNRISAIENTNIKLKEKFNIVDSTKTFPIKTFAAIAASLVILFGSYFVIQSNIFTENSQVAKNNIEELKELETVVPEQIETFEYDSANAFQEDSLLVLNDSIENDEVEEEASEKLEFVENEKVNKINKKDKKEITANNSNSKQIGQAEYDKYRNNTDNTSLKDVEEPEEEKILISPASTTNTIYSDDESIQETIATSNLSDYKKGISAYNKSDYNKAIKLFNKSISLYKSVNSSNYYIAMSYFNQNKNLKAIKHFDMVIKSSSSHRANAKWYKALTLIKRGERLEAKILLQDIANSNSKFSVAAKEKLINF